MVFSSSHLKKSEQIILGSFYTPEYLVEKVYQFISLFLRDNSIIFDPAAGMGAFLFKNNFFDYRAAEYDMEAYNYLIEFFDPEKIFFTNSLLNVNRKKFKILESSHLISSC